MSLWRILSLAAVSSNKVIRSRALPEKRFVNAKPFVSLHARNPDASALEACMYLSEEVGFDSETIDLLRMEDVRQ